MLDPLLRDRCALTDPARFASPRGVAALLTAAVLAAVLVAAGSPGAVRSVAAAAEAPPYAWPVRGPVLREFEAPASRFEAGHRGIDIAASLGTPVLASAAGVVAFAGSVAGSRFVSIDHPDGIRTTYSWLSQIGVRRGDTVERGAVIGATGHGHPEVAQPHLHFGARIGEDYLDPLVLLGASGGRVHLAQVEGAGGAAGRAGNGGSGGSSFGGSVGFGLGIGIGSSEGLPARRVAAADAWLWSRVEPKPLVLPGRAGGERPP